MIKIGPSGIGGKKEAKEFLELLHNKGINAAEVAFTYSVYLKKEDAIEIGNLAKKLNIDLSIHASYFINLNSDDSNKLEQSKKRLLQACEIGHFLQAKYIVFHPGYYGNNKEGSYENIKKHLLEIKAEVDKNKWNILLAPETMGRVNVFGSLDETLRLSKETKTSFCLDFAHLKARNIGNINFKEVIVKLKSFKHIHCHYSGIEYTDKGEKNHIPIDLKEFKQILNDLRKENINCTIICESPEPLKDAIKMKELI